MFIIKICYAVQIQQKFSNAPHKMLEPMIKSSNENYQLKHFAPLRHRCEMIDSQRGT